MSLSPSYPRPLAQIHQLELTSRCSLACPYCIQPSMLRLRRDMDWATFERALVWVSHFCLAGTQGELNLAGVGESFLHPRFPEMVALARRTVGPHRKLILATNGLNVTPAVVEVIRPYNPRIYVSLHRPDRAAAGLQLLRGAGLLDGISTDPATNANDWAGQVDWPPGAAPARFACPWLQRGWGFVASDGKILACCLDGTGESAVGHVTDDPPEASSPSPEGGNASSPGGGNLAPWRLCGKCYQDP